MKILITKVTNRLATIKYIEVLHLTNDDLKHFIENAVINNKDIQWFTTTYDGNNNQYNWFYNS